MPEGPLSVHRLPPRLTSDARRTITRFFWPGGENRARNVVDRVLALDTDEVARLFEATTKSFKPLHPDLEEVLREHYELVARRIQMPGELTDDRRLLIGAYFTMEYAFESAALFNPSMVPAADQDGAGAGEMRFIMSLRAVGEGHVSSIVFRTGAIEPDGDVRINPPGRIRRMQVVENRRYDKHTFLIKLIEIGAYNPVIDPVLERLPESFTMRDLLTATTDTQVEGENAHAFAEAAESTRWLARSNYKVRWSDATGLEEFVLFPVSETESQGMEDMRLVRFVDDDGTTCYYGTYTAYNGRQILPQLLECSEPGVAEIHTLNGRYAQNKGMALFPRKLDGWFAMITRVDGESLYLAKSRNVRFWNEAERIQQPKYAWEFVQIGNCGSPLETQAGWLMLTHGVGPMRRYSIGVSLLDLEDPSKVIGQLEEPLLTPTAEERSGYVPNVVYSCGGMVHNGKLIIPYGISDAATGFAVVDMDALLSRLR